MSRAGRRPESTVADRPTPAARAELSIFYKADTGDARSRELLIRVGIAFKTQSGNFNSRSIAWKRGSLRSPSKLGLGRLNPLLLPRHTLIPGSFWRTRGLGLAVSSISRSLLKRLLLFQFSFRAIREVRRADPDAPEADAAAAVGAADPDLTSAVDPQGPSHVRTACPPTSCKACWDPDPWPPYSQAPSRAGRTP